MNTVTFPAPSAWASYLINGDDSGIPGEDKAQCDAWLENLGMGAPLCCSDAGFIWHHDAYAQCPLGADCQYYAFFKVQS